MLDDKAVNVLKSYEQLTAAYSKDIDEYRKIISSMETLVADKQKKIKEMTDKTISLVTSSLAAPTEAKAIPTPKQVAAITEPATPKQKKTDKPEKAKKTRSKKTAKKTGAVAAVDLKCLYHPEAPVLDKARQLCSTCKWRLINSGLKDYDKDPQVIAYLKGETKDVPSLGQSMCPIHPAVSSYNKTTGLCKTCQKKAKAMNLSDRKPTDEELNMLRMPIQ